MTCNLCGQNKLQFVMPDKILTRRDLAAFKADLLHEIRKIIASAKQPTAQKLLKSKEVRALLKVSPRTLHTLRLNGTLSFVKVGGTIYYRYNDIEALLNLKTITE